MEAHDEIVSALAERIKGFHQAQRPFRVYHGSTNSTRPSQRRADNIVDTSKLGHVLKVDESRKAALVEPNVPMDVLIEATLKTQLVPLVVMEFPNITVGGGFSGSAGESSSFRHGPFDNTINWIEVVLPTGEVRQASKTSNADLFWGAASGFGTLGVVTLLEVQLRDAKQYVELTYHPSSLNTAFETLEQQTQKPGVEYLDAIAFSAAHAVVCSGRLVNNIPNGTAPVRFTRRKDPWFYLHVQTRVSTGASESVVDYVPIIDYFFRYDRGGFWVARYAFRYFFTPFNRLTRSVLDRFMHASTMYHVLHQSRLADSYIIQDVGIPFSQMSQFQNWLDSSSLRTYPLWLCPLRVRRDTPDSNYGIHADLAWPSTPEFFMNFGIWGPGARDRADFIRQNRELEKKVQELGGKKTLYAHAYYTEEEFWQSYDRESYEELRRKYGAKYLPSVYDKVRVELDAEKWPQRPFGGVRPLQGLLGVWKAWRGGDYLLVKKKSR